MASYGNKITTSLYGRRLGLQLMTSGESGGASGMTEMLVGPNGFREQISTSPSTASSEVAYGVSLLKGTSVASTPVFTLDPPIPGIYKTIVFGSTDSALYIKTKNSEPIMGTSLGNTGAGYATVCRSSGGGVCTLVGVTTGLWMALNLSSSALNATEFQATT